MSDHFAPGTAAEAMLLRLKANGVDYLFANAGTDFPPIIEGLANGLQAGAAMPTPLVIPHESAAVAMAHGYYLATGRAQAVMVHVNVGLANTVMGVINAASENIPLFLLAGRTPVTEHDRFGARMTPIQFGQEMRDQGAMVREVTKWDYELRYGEQVADLVDRALSIAMAEPKGPVYLGLPREPLSEPWPDTAPLSGRAHAVPSPPLPDPGAVARAADILAAAKAPLIVCQRGDPAGRLGAALASLAADHAIPVSEFWGIRNVLASGHPMNIGADVGPWIGKADAIVAVDSMVPWIPRDHRLRDDAKVIHIGPDPLFSRLPVRSLESDLAITGEPVATVAALAAELDRRGHAAPDRFAAIRDANAARREEVRKTALAGDGAPMTPAYVSHCLSRVLDDRAMVFSELGAPAAFADVAGPNQWFTPAFSGGLGWGVPAALGACLADRDRLVVACVGDGSYVFANPVACHQIAEALDLPALIVVLNNGVWNAVRRSTLALYPDGKAAAMNRMPITSLSPNPDYTRIAEASRGWGARVESGADLPRALDRAVEVIRKEGRQALLEVMVSA